MKFLEIPTNLFRAHLLLQKMSRFPTEFREMRETFVRVIQEKGLATAYELEAAARLKSHHDGVPEDEQDTIQEYIDAFIDLYFAVAVDPKEVDGYINLARKVAKTRQLAKVLNWENASSREIYNLLEDFCQLPLEGLVVPENEAVGVRVSLINHFVSSQLPYIGIAKNYITMRDIYDILQRTVWNPERSGRIGGKAAGLILAHRILLPLYKETRPEFAENIRVPDSYFIRSEILSEFLQKNNLEKYHSQKYQSLETIERDYPKIQEEFERAKFPEDTIQGFRYILERVGEHPVILRSSSFLEDNFGLAFSGKYESIFLANQGDIEDRLREFIHAVKMVHLSTYHPDPIRYRADHNLLDFNEHMSVLVQKVVGRRFGDYFFPFAGGVVFSHNSFVWDPKIDREAGLMRLVLGLGTRAVDRVGGDYPRMVPLSHPTLRPEADARAIRKYSQKKVDVLHLKTNRIVSLNLADLLREIRHPEMHLAVSVAEGDHLQNLVSRLSDFDPASASLTFDRMLKETGFPFLIREMVQALSQAYGWPVDVEFAYDDGKIYLLQCRTLSIPKESRVVDMPQNIAADKLVFATDKATTNRVIPDLEYVVFVDPPAYDRLATQEEKLLVARAVNRINQALADKRFGLFGPGRWGSNDINLGVPVRYHDISKTKILGEVAFSTDGITPEVSYGTHFFNDLVEADIVPLPLYPDQEGGFFNRAFFRESPSVLYRIAPGFESLEEVVRVIHVPEVRSGELLQVYLNTAKSKGVGFIGPKQGQNSSAGGY